MPDKNTSNNGDKTMKIALLASNPDLYSHKRLTEEAKQRGHEVIFLKIRDCYMSTTDRTPTVHYQGSTIDDIDAVIPRIRPAVTFYGTAVLRQFEVMGAYCLNGSISISRSRDKLRSLQMMAIKGIDMPATGFANSPVDSKDLIQLVGGAPVIIKLLESTAGAGVILAESDKGAESVIDGFKTLKANFLVQEFIKEAGGKDIRCFVVGNKVVASMQRQAKEGEFRANVHKGGTVSSIDLTTEEKKIAIEAAKLMNLQVAGVDLIRSNSGPKILEVNSSPGLQGIEKASGVNIAGKMIEYLEKQGGRKQLNLLSLIGKGDKKGDV